MGRTANLLHGRATWHVSLATAATARLVPQRQNRLERYIAREVFTAIVNPPTDIPHGSELRQARLQARLPLVTVASAHGVATIELSRLERGLQHNTDLDKRVQAWLDDYLTKNAWHL